MFNFRGGQSPCSQQPLDSQPYMKCSYISEKISKFNAFTKLCNFLWVYSFYVLTVGRCGWLWLVVALCVSLWLIVACYDSLWEVVARCGSLWLVIFINIPAAKWLRGDNAFTKLCNFLWVLFILFLNCGSLWLVVARYGLLWVVAARFGSLWLIVTCCGLSWVVVVCCRSLWFVVARCIV